MTVEAAPGPCLEALTRSETIDASAVATEAAVEEAKAAEVKVEARGAGRIDPPGASAVPPRRQRRRGQLRRRHDAIDHERGRELL